MTKAELISKAAEKSGLTKKDTEAAVKATFEAITEALAAGETFVLTGFGSFTVKERSARTGRDPRTGEPLEIPASRYVSFKEGKNLKDSVNA